MSATPRRKREPTIVIPPHGQRATLEGGEAPPPQELSPEQKKLNDLLKELMEACTSEVIKVAACQCEDKDDCSVYKKAKDIARIIDEVTELRGKVEGTAGVAA